MQTNHVLPFLSSIESQNMTSAEGVDHVAHDEMMPYRSSEDPLVDHKLFHHLFSQQQTAPTGRRQHVAAHMYAVRTEHVWQPTDKLTKWHNRQKLMLNASNVYRETTKDVRVTVMPFFIGSSKRLNETTYWVSRVRECTRHTQCSVEIHIAYRTNGRHADNGARRQVDGVRTRRSDVVERGARRKQC
jgi:polymerase delta-interacting protein 2